MSTTEHERFGVSSAGAVVAQTEHAPLGRAEAGLGWVLVLVAAALAAAIKTELAGLTTHLRDG